MHKQIFAVLVLAAVALAGCAGNDASDTPEPQPTQDAAPAPLTFTACDEVLAVVAVPYDDIQSGLPEGYTATPFDPAGQFASGVLLSLECEGDLHEWYIMADVQPPEDVRVEADMQMFHYIAVSNNELHRQTYDAWNVWAVDGDVMNDVRDLGALRYAQTEFVGAEAEATVISQVHNPGNAPAGSAALYHENEDGEIVRMLVEWTEHEQWMGTATASFGGGVLPVNPASGFHGIGFHNMGPDYEMTMRLIE